MIQRRQNLRFALESRESIRVVPDAIRKHLDGDRSLQIGIDGAIHLTHVAFAQHGDDFVGAESSARGERHGHLSYRHGLPP